MSSNGTSSKFSFWIKLGLVVVLAGLTYYFGSSYLSQYITLDDVLKFIESSGVYAPLTFIVAYGFLPIIPATALTIASGALFGPFWGTVYSICGATVAMTYPFWITRYFGKKPLKLVLSNSGGFEEKFEKFQCNVEKDGWKYVAFTRLVPLFPFTFLNYFFGLTRISFWQYLLTSIVFITPAAATYVYIGFAGREAAQGAEGLYLKVGIALACLAVLALVPKLISYLRGDKKDNGC